jgi:hypothetical protein
MNLSQKNVKRSHVISNQYKLIVIVGLLTLFSFRPPTNINTGTGLFCALPEAWAEYMMYQVAMQYYPTQEFNLFDVALGSFQNRVIEGHAELNLFFGGASPFSFIPNGLFYDLMDIDPNRFGDEVFFDRVSGFTTAQIFNIMRSDVRSMQVYRQRFEALYGTSPFLTALFQQYSL